MYLIDSTCGTLAMFPTCSCASQPTPALPSSRLLLPLTSGCVPWWRLGVGESVHAELGNCCRLCRHTQTGFKPSDSLQER